MRDRTLLLPLGSLFAFTLAFASPLHGQNISSGDTTGRRSNQEGRAGRLSQATKAKPIPAPAASAAPPGQAQNPQTQLPGRSAPLAALPNLQRHRIGAQGLVSYFGSGAGLEYLYQPWDWLLGGFSYVHTSAGLGQSESKSTEEYLDGSLNGFKIQIQYRALSPVYFGLGLSLVQIQGQHGWRGEGVAGGQIASEFDAQLYSADFILGSEWTLFRNFYVGIDWFGLAWPFAGSITVDSSEEADLTTNFLTGSTIERRVNSELSAQFKLYYLILRAGYRF